MSLKGDTTEKFTKYMARLNESLAQLHMILKRRLPLILVLDSVLFFSFVGAYRGFFFSLFLFPFSPGFLHGGHVHGGHVTHNPPFATRRLRFIKSASLK